MSHGRRERRYNQFEFSQRAGQVPKADSNFADTRTSQSSLLFVGHDSFDTHLQNRANEIKTTISALFARAPQVPEDVAELQTKLSKKLAEEKVAIAELEKALADKQQLEERLEAASRRYMVAEKKLDRAKSLTVARLEKQYLLGAQKPGGDSSGVKREEGVVNGSADSPERMLDLEASYNKTVAISEAQKQQLEKLEAENSKLLTQITDLNIKVGTIQ